MNRRLLLFLFMIVSASVLSGCASYLYQTLPVQQFQIEFLSEPSGARIEVNNEYLGTTPLTLPYEGTNRYARSLIIIRALPTQPGHYVQRKLILSGDYIPRRVFFDMRLGPATPSVNVNVQSDSGY